MSIRSRSSARRYPAAVEEEATETETEAQPDPQAEARRRVALAQIRQYPDPALRLRANEVEQFDEHFERLVRRLTELMHDAHGVGLAATQVGVLQRVFVFLKDEDDEGTAIVNPVVTARSDETEIEEEGCLSLQNVRVPVERNVTVTIEGQDATGAPLRLELEDLRSRVAQHELDHLDGVLMIHRTDDEARKRALGILRAQPVLGGR